MGETVNFWGSLVALVGCVVFIGVYSVMPFLTGRSRWWHSLIGRMLVAKAAAIAGLMLIVIAMYVCDIQVEWVRATRGVFSALVGVMMAYQGYLVYKIQSKREDT